MGKNLCQWGGIGVFFITFLLSWILGVDVVNISIVAPADRAIEVVSLLVSLPLFGGELSRELLVFPKTIGDFLKISNLGNDSFAFSS